MNKTIRAYGYCRISKKTEDSVSLNSQADRIVKYCEYKGFKLEGIIKDDGISGGINKLRAGFVELLEIVESGNKADVVVLFSLERLSRDMLTMLALERYLDEYDIQLHTVEGQVDTSTPENFMSFAMRAFLGEMERRQVKYRTRKAMEFKKQNGQVFGKTPYGYKRVGKSLEECPEEQAVIKRINKMYKKGMRLIDIARKLTKEGSLTRTGKPWDSTQVKRLIRGYEKKWNRKRSPLGETIKNFILSVA